MSSASQWRHIVQRLKDLNAKPQVIKEIQDWTKSTQQNIQQAKIVSSEIKKVIELSKEPKGLSNYIKTLLQTSFEGFKEHTNHYVNTALILFVCYKFFSSLGFLARFSNIELIQYVARYFRLIYFSNYFAYFLKNWMPKRSIVEFVRSTLVLFVILFVENIVSQIFKLWKKIGSSSEISTMAQNAYKITIIILAYIYLKEVKNQVYKLATFNGELVDSLINLVSTQLAK